MKTTKTPPAPGMKRSRVPWSTKLRPDMKPEVVADSRHPGRLLLPTPMQLAKEIARIPKGSVLTMSALRDRLARRNDADRTCPLMAGIFFNIVAGAAEEQIAAETRPLAPYWRVVRDDGTLSPKTPAGPERQAEHLRQEGHPIHASGTGLRLASAASDAPVRTAASPRRTRTARPPSRPTPAPRR